MQTFRPKEKWKGIAGYSWYEVSNYGRIRSLITTRGEGGIRKLNPDRKGYIRVRLLGEEGQDGTKYVHRLVAEALMENPKGLEEVEHEDGHPQNNNVGNLSWIGHREKMRAAIGRRGGFWMKGVENRGAWKAITAIDPRAGGVRRFESVRAAIEWLSGETVAAGGEELRYEGTAGNLNHAVDQPKMIYGHVWASGEVKDGLAYLGKLRPNHRSPLAKLLQGERVYYRGERA
jgi:hypothetical protein